MIEVEMKSLVERTTDPERIEVVSSTLMRSLTSRGARFRCLLMQNDVYMEHPCRDLARTDESIRIRSEIKEGVEKIKVTYKGPKVSQVSKSRKEIELALSLGSGLKEALDLFNSIGFSEKIRIQKTRRELEMDGVTLCVDSVEGLGVFLEAEIMSETLQDAEMIVQKAMSSLGHTVFERRSYLELILGG